MDLVFETYPRYEGKAEYDVEEPFVADRENDKDGRECEKYHHQPMEVMALRSDPMQERHCDR